MKTEHFHAVISVILLIVLFSLLIYDFMVESEISHLIGLFGFIIVALLSANNLWYNKKMRKKK